MPSLSALRGKRPSLLIALAVLSCACREHVDEDTLGPGAHRGEVLYTNHCVACHGMDGRGRVLPAPQGDGVVSRNLVTKAFQAERSDDELMRAIREGVPPWMPAFEQVLSPDEVRDVVTHVRRLSSAPTAGR